MLVVVFAEAVVAAKLSSKIAESLLGSGAGGVIV